MSGSWFSCFHIKTKSKSFFKRISIRMPFYFFTILKGNFIIYNIPFYNTAYIKKFYYFIFLLKYYFLTFFIISFPTSLFQDSKGNIFLSFRTFSFFFPDFAFSNSHIFLGYATLFFFPTVMLIPVAFPWPLSFLPNSDVFSNGDTEIQRTKREKGTEVPDNGERNFREKKRWNKILIFFKIVLQYNFNFILIFFKIVLQYNFKVKIIL